jgi:hypothetical protein
MQLQVGKQRREGRTQRTIAVVLFVILILPVLALFVCISSQNDEAILPACCRSQGKHHCFMRGMATHASPTNDSPVLAQVSERCPFQQFGPSPHIPAQFGSPSGAERTFSHIEERCPAPQSNRSAKNLAVCANHQRGPPNSGDNSLTTES